MLCGVATALDTFMPFVFDISAVLTMAISRACVRNIAKSSPEMQPIACAVSAANISAIQCAVRVENGRPLCIADAAELARLLEQLKKVGLALDALTAPEPTGSEIYPLIDTLYGVRTALDALLAPLANEAEDDEADEADEDDDEADESDGSE